MPDAQGGQCGKMPHSFPGGGEEWAQLELTDAEVGVYTKIMPWILLFL